VGVNPGSKRDKARALGVPELDEAGLQELVRPGWPPTIDQEKASR
jgi:hypothetical protein